MATTVVGIYIEREDFFFHSEAFFMQITKTVENFVYFLFLSLFPNGGGGGGGGVVVVEK